MSPLLLRAGGLTLAGLTFLTACGDDSDDAAAAADDAATAADDAATAAGDDAYCDASLAIELLPDPDVDFENATPEEIGAAFQQWVADDLRPLLDRIQPLVPDEIREPADQVITVFAEMEDTGDPALLEDAAFDEALDTLHAFSVEQCGWASVALTATDYHFDGALPTTAGVTSFEVTNNGAEFHFAILGRKHDDVADSVEDAFAGVDTEESFNEIFDEVLGIDVEPGSSNYDVVDLAPGEYVLFCPVPVGSVDAEGDGPPHFTQGMVETFVVS